MTRWRLEGILASVAFASGDRFVVGHWADTPIGPLTEVRWTKPSGERALVVTDKPAAELIGAVYSFDTVERCPIDARAADRWIELVAGPVELQLQAKAGWRVPFKRPVIVTQLLEDRIARSLFELRAYEHTASATRVWYQADVVRPVAAGWATVDGRDLGAMAPRPSIASVRPVLEDPSGRLDEIVRAAARARIGADESG